jgi:hypothetical protein
MRFSVSRGLELPRFSRFLGNHDRIGADKGVSVRTRPANRRGPY